MSDIDQSTSAKHARTAGRRTAFSPSIRTLEQILKLGELPKECESDDTGWTVALLRDDQFRLALILIIGFVDLFTVNEHHDIGVLLDRTRFAQIRQLRPVIALTLFRRAAQLRKGDYGNFEFLRQSFQPARYPRNLLHAILDFAVT